MTQDLLPMILVSMIQADNTEVSESDRHHWIAGTNYSSLSQSDVNHMWWTGDEDPQTVASRYAMATMVSGAGDTATFLMAIVAGSGLENVKQAVFNARKAYDWDWNLPKPPAAPQMTSDAVKHYPMEI